MCKNKCLDANDLLQGLKELEIKHGSLIGIPLSAFVKGDRESILDIDPFYDGEDQHLHSIDLNISFE